MAKTKSGLNRFTLATDDLKPRIIGRSSGEYGTGKTTFWLGAPGPIVIQSLDKGLEGVVEPFTKEKDIYVAEYDWQPTTSLDQDEAIALRDKFIEDFEYAIQHARTVIWDKETDIYELFRYAEFGGPSDSPLNYPALYQRYRRYINMPKATSINFGVIQAMKDEWMQKSKVDKRTGQSKQTGAPTGNRIRAGYREVDGLVHTELQHRREGGVFFIDVGKSRGPGSGNIQDQTFENLTFVEFAQLVFPETEESDWV